LRRWTRSVAFLAAALGGISCTEVPQGPPRNIVIVLIDQLRADRVGAYGSRLGLTPEIDSLAREGFVFERARSAAPWTYPSVVSLLTGLTPARHGAGRLRGAEKGWWIGPVSQNLVTLAERLQALGFETAGFVANPYLKPGVGVNQGFGLWRHDFVQSWASDPANSHAKWWQASSYADSVNKAVLAWAASSSAPRRFAYVHYIDAHGPWDAAPFLTDAEKRDLSYGEKYHRGIHYVDARVGELWHQLRRLWGDDLLLIVTSDHGQAQRPEDVSNPLKENKGSLHDFNLRVPLILASHGSMRVRGRWHGNVSLVDVAPTLIELVGGDPHDPPFEGQSLVPILEGRASPSHERRIYAENRDRGLASQALLLGQDKYVAVAQPVRGHFHYHLEMDPDEMAPLLSRESDEERARFQELAKSVAARRALAPKPADVQLDPEVVERLRALGYTVGPEPNAQGARKTQ